MESRLRVVDRRKRIEPTRLNPQSEIPNPQCLAPALARCGASPYDDGQCCQAMARRGNCVGPFLFVGARRTSPNPMVYQFIALLNHGLLLAEDAPAAQPDPNFIPRLLMTVAGAAAVFYFVMIRPQKKKDDDFKQLLSNLKENDHVVTIGGIYGVVTNVQRDADRVTIRVDESTGTKLRVGKSAIARVISDDADGDSPASGKQK
jgi:preprotein translocase subunit YajC